MTRKYIHDMKVRKQIEALIILLTIHTYTANILIQIELLSLEFVFHHIIKDESILWSKVVK